jgi:hypothetical protein
MWRVGEKPEDDVVPELDVVPDDPPELDVDVPERPSRMRRQSLSVSQPRKRHWPPTHE